MKFPDENLPGTKSLGQEFRGRKFRVRIGFDESPKAQGRNVGDKSPKLRWKKKGGFYRPILPKINYMYLFFSFSRHC